MAKTEPIATTTPAAMSAPLVPPESVEAGERDQASADDQADEAEQQGESAADAVGRELAYVRLRHLYVGSVRCGVRLGHVRPRISELVVRGSTAANVV